MQKKYIALIPAYKPTAFLLDLVQELNRSGFSVVLVNDGSGTEFDKLFFECSRFAVVLSHESNSGKGCALKTGLSYIFTHYTANAMVVTVDADGQHRVGDALAICHITEQNPDGLVLGSRRLEDNVPLRSQFGNTVTRFVYHIATGLSIHDTQTGLRAFHSSFIPILLAIPGKRYEYEMNVLLYCSKENIPIIEHEIETIYIDKNSQSHFHIWKDSIRIYKEILKFSLSSFIGFLIDYISYSLLLLLTGNLLVSNIIARILSANVNFSINRRFVFQSKENIKKATAKYFLLAAGILLGNTHVLDFFVNTCDVHPMVAKIITEVLFFVISWLAQKLVIFRKHTGGVR